MKLVELRQLARARGLPISGTKPVLLKRLQEHERQHHDVLLSIDVGYRNLAHAITTTQFPLHIYEWTNTRLPLDDAYSAQHYASTVHAWTENILPSLKTYRVTACLIERQRFFSRTRHSIPFPVLKSNVIEALLHAELRPHVQLYTIDPRAVALCLKPDLEVLGIDMKKKQAAVRLVEHVLSDSGVVQPSEIFGVFREETKRDDLADALLQALAWSRWNRPPDME